MESSLERDLGGRLVLKLCKIASQRKDQASYIRKTNSKVERFD